MPHPGKQLKDWWRIPRVLFHLAIRPRDWLRYVRAGAFTKKSPVELGMPWWSFGAVDAMAARLRKDQDVFEYGSGGSTLFLGARARSVVCVEDEQEWADLVAGAAAKAALGGVTVLHRPFDFWQTDAFGASDYLLALSGRAYDVIVVDGKEWSVAVRDHCFWHAERHVKQGGVIVLDDSWRYPQVKARNQARRWKEYKGVGYCRVGVTSTCIFEY